MGTSHGGSSRCMMSGSIRLFVAGDWRSRPVESRSIFPRHDPRFLHSTWNPHTHQIHLESRKESLLRYEILYQPSFSLAAVSLERGEQVMAESGAMVSMSPTIRMEARMSGGGALGAIKSAVGGESMFRTTYTAESGPGEVTFAPSSLGDIMATEMKGTKMFVQPGSYLAGDPRLTIGVQGSMGAMLSGEGLFLLTVEGSGLLLLSSFGASIRRRCRPARSTSSIPATSLPSRSRSRTGWKRRRERPRAWAASSREWCNRHSRERVSSAVIVARAGSTSRPARSPALHVSSCRSCPGAPMGDRRVASNHVGANWASGRGPFLYKR